MKDHITTIALDFGGVLVRHIGDDYLCHMAAAARAPEAEFLNALWKHRNRYDAGDIDSRDYWRMVIDDSGAEHVGISPSSEGTFKTLIHLDSLGWSHFRPSMLRWVAALRREGYRCFILSNMAPEMYDMVIRDSILLSYFERVVLSGWLHINKPDREIFLEASRQMEVSPGEILFVDDFAHNVDGARNAGFHALQFTDTVRLARNLEEEYPEIPRQGLECISR